MSPIYCFQFYIYSFCIQLFIMYTYVVYYSDLFYVSLRNDLLPEYDYIIVGSGTAGSLIAHRLATETNYTFIVLEAGPRGQVLMDMPIVGPVIHRSLFDWQFETVPQEHACNAIIDNKCRIPQGKIFGGSAKLNNMVHVRGNISHYVEWFHGRHTEKYITRQFEFLEKTIFHINDVLYESELANGVLQAAKELGYNELSKEFNKGFMKSKLSQKNGKRWSTSDNLDVSKHVLTNVLVEKVVIKDDVAKGVAIRLLNENKTIFARKGVILSAGTFNSPKILQLSGIGPSKLLKSLGIPVVKNLPVGKNLQDHVSAGLDLIVFNESLSIGASDIVNPLNSLLYFFLGKGPLTTAGCEVIGFLSKKNETTPNLQFMVLPVGISSDRGSRLRKSLGVKDDIWYNYFAKSFNMHTASILPIILHPKSRGYVSINSKDAEKPPLIDPKYLTSEIDRQILVDGLKLVKKFVSTEAMKNIGAYINPIPLYGCENFPIFTDPYWECYIKHLALTSYHPVGTCSMGLQGSHSVVDTTFRVIGINNLYVADGSVLPSLPSGNINAAVAMMASVFFDTNIKLNNSMEIKSDLLCYRNDLFYGFIFKLCYVNVVY